MNLDESFVLWMSERLGSPLLDPIFVWLSDRWAFSIPLAGWLLLDSARRAGRKGLALGMFLILAVVLGDQTGNALKRVFHEPRPCSILEVYAQGPEAGARRACPVDGNGAVSNHALNFALATVLLSRSTPWTSWHRGLAVATGLVAISRVYLGRHYPSQVLAGLAVGAVLGILGAAVACRLRLCVGERPPSRAVVAPPPPAEAIPRAHRLAFLLLLAAQPLVRAALQQAAGLELHFDEAQYWDWSQHLDWSYYSKGPLAAWLIAASTAWLGDGEWQIRLPAWLAFDAFLIVTFLATREVSGSLRAAWWATALAVSTPLLFLLGGIMTTDALLLPLWTLGLWGAWRVAERGEPAGWYMLGAALGLGVLTKLSILLLPLFAAPLLFLSPGARATLKTVHPWAAGALALALAAPVLGWNASHDWVLLRHDQGHLLGPGERGNLLELLLGQAAAALPIVAGVAIAALWRAPNGQGPRLLWGVSVTTLGLNAFKAVWSKVQMNWPTPGYLGLLLLLGARAPGLSRLRQNTLRATMALGLAIAVLAHFPGIAGLRGARDPFGEMKAWRGPLAELANRAGAVDFLLAPRYTLASELAFYWPGRPPVYLAGDSRRRMSQHDLWPGVEREAGRTGLFVSHRPNPPETLERAFEACTALAPLQARTPDGDPVRTLYAWRCTGYRPTDWPAPGRY